jgi:hypothetical protein
VSSPSPRSSSVVPGVTAVKWGRVYIAVAASAPPLTPPVSVGIGPPASVPGVSADEPPKVPGVGA